MSDTQTTAGWAETPATSSLTGIESVSLIGREEQDEHKHLRQITRRQIMRNGRKPGGKYQTTVGAVAKAASLSVDRVVAQLQDGWLITLGADRSEPIATWTLEEDGE